MHFYQDPQSDSYWYNRPSHSEVAAVFESANDGLPSHRHYFVYPKKCGLTKVYCDTMH